LFSVEKLSLDLLCEWSAFLKCGLYTDALIFFLGGKEKVICSVEIYYDNRIVGNQKMLLLDNKTAFHLYR